MNSLKVASACGVIATLLGVMVSFPLARRKVWFRSGISALLLLPLVVPTVVLGVALLILFQRGFLHVPLGLGAVLIAPRDHRAAVLRAADHAPHREHRQAPRGGRLRPRRERVHDVPAGDPAADHPGHPVGVPDRVRGVDRRGRRRELPHQRLRHVSDLPLLGPQVPREDADADPDRDRHDRAVVPPRLPGRGAAPRRRAPRRHRAPSRASDQAPCHSPRSRSRPSPLLGAACGGEPAATPSDDAEDAAADSAPRSC